jgi:hypothetical protein
MSTRSCILLKVRKEDIGKVISFRKAALPVPLEDWTGDGGKEISKPVKIEKEFIGIYCHWDGYPEGVGAALKKNFTNYEQVLNLLTGGDCSCVDEAKVIHYANREGEEWDDIHPRQDDTAMGLAKVFERADAEYAYLFDGDTCEWCYKPLYGTNNGFEPL